MSKRYSGKSFKPLLTLFLGILFIIPTFTAKSKEITETKTVVETVKELGTFEKPLRTGNN